MASRWYRWGACVCAAILFGACSGSDGDESTGTGTGGSEGDHDSLSASGASDGVGTTTTGLPATGDLTIQLVRGAGVIGGPTEDGWVVDHQRFVVSVGQAAAQGTALDEHHVVNLRSRFRQALGTVRGLSGWVDTATAEVGPVQDPVVASGVEAADLDLLRSSGASLLVDGTLESSDGVSCTPGDPDTCVPAPLVRFRWAIEGTATLAACEGVAVLQGEVSLLSLEVHGDRWLRTGFTGLDGSVLRAQWIADADLDHDGETTLDELKSIKAADLFGAEYDLVDSAPFEIVTAHDFLRAHVTQLSECWS